MSWSLEGRQVSFIYSKSNGLTTLLKSRTAVLLCSVVGTAAVAAVVCLARGGWIQASRFDNEHAPSSASADCGRIALYLACANSGHRRSMTDIRRSLPSVSKELTLLDIKEAAVALGFTANAYRGSFVFLRAELSKPGHCAVLHVRRNHFIFATWGTDASGVRIADMAGVAQANRRQLEESYRWEGVMLILSRS